MENYKKEICEIVNKMTNIKILEKILLILIALYEGD